MDNVHEDNWILICFVPLLMMMNGCKYSEPDWQMKQSPLVTHWAKDVTPQNVLPEYPRPQMVRRDWINLNGLWDLHIAGKNDSSLSEIEWDKKILVPYPVESALSGVMEKSESLWYRRHFTLPQKWHKQNILLHFGAVDWEAEVFLNGQRVGIHRGGYDAFSFDITEYLTREGKQELVVYVIDPTGKGAIARGKQADKPGGIFYTSTTGIWQTVWLEPVPQAHIRSFRLTPDLKEKSVVVSVDVSNSETVDMVSIFARSGEKIHGRAEGKPGKDIILKLAEAQVWTPQNPFLYDLEIELLAGNRVVDKIDSYLGLREISIGKDDRNITRLMLNGEFIFQIGVLDQGFWPDGLYTAPTDEALRYDIETAKKLGLNLLRKHVKYEPQRWYYWCDKLGMLVWQDMPSIHPGDLERNGDEESRWQFETELRNMITELYNHPSIIMWIVFNEGWGQYDTERLTQLVKDLDRSRVVNSASGWTDMKVGDVNDLHAYPGPEAPLPEQKRAAVLGEFGGLGLAVDLHTWTREHWGYQDMADFKNLRDRYERLLDEIWKLREEPGLSAAVYTQLTDVETEVNGLLTYDRAVVKIDEKEARAFNTDGMISPPVITPASSLFLENIEVTVNNRKGETIYYTLDGREPISGGTVYSGPIILDTTTVLKVRSKGKKDRGSAVVEAKFEKVTPTVSLIPEKALSPGLEYHYFEGGWDRLPDFDTLIAVQSGVIPQPDLRYRLREDSIGLKFSGYINIPRDGIYTFYTRSDDGSRLIIAGKPVVENDGLHGIQEQKGQIALKKGIHAIKVVFFEKSGDERLEVLFEGPGLKKMQLPSAMLFN
jgi:hypothetical protein